MVSPALGEVSGGEGVLGIPESALRVMVIKEIDSLTA
jgi:hypothetical protein